MNDEREGVARRSVVRPYVLTRGRTRSVLGVIEMHTPVLSCCAPEQLASVVTPEERAIVVLCRAPTSIAEIAGRLDTPIGVVRVLVGDLAEAGRVRIPRRDHDRDSRDAEQLERLLEGIRAL